MLNRLTAIALMAVLGSPPGIAAAPEWPALEVGRWVEVAGADRPYPAILTPAQGDSVAGAALLIPDREGHPDHDATGALRTGLARFGWLTLAINPSASTPDPVAQPEQIAAALAYLRQQTPAPIVIIGHGSGAALAAAYLADQARVPVAGLVALGWYDPDRAQGKFRATTALAALAIPVYDLYGSRDLDKVSVQAAGRLSTARETGRPYRQQVMEGADHEFTGLDQALVQRVRGWLQTRILGKNTSPKPKDRRP